MTFHWLTFFADSFVNSDWLELVIFFQTNEQDGEQNAFMVNISETMINNELLRQVCATFGI